MPHELNVPRRILLGPGPSEVGPRVLRAMSTPLVGHLDPSFVALMEDVKELLRQTFEANLGMNLVMVDARERFLAKLAGVIDPEQKRKIIGAEFIRVFEE